MKSTQRSAKRCSAMTPMRRKAAAVALSLGKDRDTQYGAGVALALSGDLPRAEAIAAQLDKNYPDDTFVKYLLPRYHPRRRRSQGQRSESGDQVPRTRERIRSRSGSWIASRLHQGSAYLRAGDGHKAAAEFQKILDHPGVVLNAPIGALARLQMARAFAAQGNVTQARSADPDVPILEEAIQEYSNRWGAQALTTRMSPISASH
jgi:eukaryotic-like serine/threonine-protein kinase